MNLLAGQQVHRVHSPPDRKSTSRENETHVLTALLPEKDEFEFP